MRAEFVIALDDDGAELEVVLVGCVDVDQEARSPTVVDARLVIRRGRGLLRGAPTRVEHLQTPTSLARRRLLAVPETLL